uniref:SpaA isopeptide-forming pilin-related protein n=1 Tax=Enterococcus faecium TaxID=1352 RepID=UPI002234C2AB
GKLAIDGLAPGAYQLVETQAPIGYEFCPTYTSDEADANQLPKTYNHIAFKIDEQDIDSFVSKIQMLGLTVEPGRSRVKGEASSIYFYDYDNHFFELHTGTLQERLKSYNSTT